MDTFVLGLTGDCVARLVVRSLCVLLLSVAVATATTPLTQIPAGLERACCASIMHQSGDCPPQPIQGMSGSCCNMQFCLQLFLQTGEVRLDPPFATLEWNTLTVHNISRLDRPPVPPPRI